VCDCREVVGNSLMVQMIKSRVLSWPAIPFLVSDPVAIYFVAPNFIASSFLLSPREIAVTSAPILLAKITPKCPNPPIPIMPTRFAVVPAPYCKSGENMVTPPQNMGAADAGSMAGGIRMAKREGPRQYLANAPLEIDLAAPALPRRY
jgi:hypothetical protein